MNSSSVTSPCAATEGSAPRDARADAAVVALVIGFAALALWNVWRDDSYWIDELFSVGASRASWNELLNVWLLRDVHPPLYQAVLKLWMAVFGSSEHATRLLSEVFALAALVAVALRTRRGSASYRIAAIAFFGSAAAFAYYAQETRSYALLLLLSTIATAGWLRPATHGAARPVGHDLVLLLLSLTHYFGLLLATLMLAMDLVLARGWRARARIAAIGPALLIWPALHALAGSVAERAGGNFWIQSSGPASTLAAVVDGVASLPYELARSGAPGAILAAISLLAGAIGLSGAWRTRGGETMGLLGLLVLMPGLVGAVDLSTPISTPRNYIVLLPAAALLFATAVEGLLTAARARSGRIAVALGVAAFLVASAAQSLERLGEKWAPIENIKGLIVALEESGVCRPECRVLRAERPLRVYLAVLGRDLPLRGVDVASALATDDETPLVVLHRHPHELVRGRFIGWSCLAPEQAWPHSTFVLLPEPTRVPGLHPCPAEA